ncbi:Holin of 3TMs, for gene-transfer release [Candidatus Electrothrix laxa]
MTDKADMWSSLGTKAIDVIFARYPARTSLGAILGGAIDFLVQLFAPALRSLEFADFTASPRWGWWLIGILMMHTPTIVSSFRQKQTGDEKIDRALDLIERGDFTKTEKRQQYRKLIERVASNVALKPELQRELKETEKKITADGKN